MKGTIFNIQEVQAIIAGNKTMFREVIKTCKQHPNNVCKKERNYHYGLDLKQDGLCWQPYGGSELQPFPYCDSKLSASTSLDEFCPYQVGQKIFCKESFADFRNNNSDIFYKSDFDLNNLVKTVDLKWKPAQHMKQEQSRLTLEITNIKVERLQDISEGDAIKEGLDLDSEHSRLCLNIQDQPYSNDLIDDSAFKTIFAKNWNATHKKPEEKFEANPFVWVVDFKINK